MKINDVDIYVKDNRIVIGRENVRGNVKSDCKDVTEKVIEFFLKHFETDEDHYMTYKLGEDVYKLDCRKLTKEEIEENARIKKEKGEEALKKFNGMCMALGFDNVYKYEVNKIINHFGSK